MWTKDRLSVLQVSLCSNANSILALQVKATRQHGQCGMSVTENKYSAQNLGFVGTSKTGCGNIREGQEEELGQSYQRAGFDLYIFLYLIKRYVRSRTEIKCSFVPF